ncbi:MAG: MOSC domain-containing protein [Austwickia sp.]|jgi:MOSC domain-containing protein YiiM|nr:MOSC domain-containing protein [Austwickia sp.]MBK8435112.1 MOSC domain-containing protein [Austwickia sp.]MBK9101335.1 MOSC domain-containing protein [Austwickia sp.]
MAELISVNVVAQLRPIGSRSGASSAIDKRPVLGPVAVGELGLAGDRQENRVHHGGPAKAVYAYALEDQLWWAEQLGRSLGPGWFGENLTTHGVDVSGSRVGDVWIVGEVVLQVTMPRTPCATFARWTGEPRWVKRFAQARRPGAYLRVLTPGEVATGMPIVVRPARADAPAIVEDAAT